VGEYAQNVDAKEKKKVASLDVEKAKEPTKSTKFHIA